ncbi:MAG: TonB-dependent receptor [Bacteroidota bacterium]
MIALTLLLLLGIASPAQDSKFTVSGTVRDGSSGEDLPGATVLVKQLPGTGAYANEYGFFSLSLPAGEYDLIIRFVGFDPLEQSVVLDQDRRLNLELLPEGGEDNLVVIESEVENEEITSSEMSVVKINPKEIESVPVIFGEKDIMKTIQLFPGVQAAGEGQAGFNVRGGSADQNLILLDEAPVYNASHLLGFFSVFNSDAIRDVELLKGSLPAEYGGRLSSVMDVRMREGNNKEFKVNGGIGLIASRATVEGPIVKEKGSFMLSGRRTYADLFLKLSSDSTLNNTQLYFYDINAKTNYQLGQNDRIFLSGYFGRDEFAFGDDFSFGWGNATGTLRWNHIFNEKLFSNTSLVFSNYNYKFAVNQAGFSLNSTIRDWTLKQDYQFYLNQKNTLKFGLEAIYHTFIPNEILSENDEGLFNEVEGQEQYGLESALYISNEQKINNRLTLNYGVRLTDFAALGAATVYDYDTEGNITDTTEYASGELITNYFNLEPRASAVFLLNENNSIKGSYARTNQYVHLLSNSTTSTPTDIWVPSSERIKPQVSDQFALGYFTSVLDREVSLSAEVYYKNLRNVIDYRTGAEVLLNPQVESDLVFGQGRAYGLELLARKNKGKLTGWVSYTLSRSERQFDEINQGTWFAARQDRTHDISVVGMYKFAPRWELGLTWVYYTGNAVTFPSGKYTFNGNTVSYYTERNGYRMPDYHRLDLGLTRYSRTTKLETDDDGNEVEVPKRFTSNWNLSVYNAYNRKNAYSIDFRESTTNPGTTEAVRLALFGIVPSLTFNFSF